MDVYPVQGSVGVMAMQRQLGSPAAQPDHVGVGALFAITAKTDQSRQTTATMSLVQHGRDSAAVMGWLWDHWLSRNVRSRFIEHFHHALEELPLTCEGSPTASNWSADEDEGVTGAPHPAHCDELFARTFVQWIAACHDCGKASPAFQLNLTHDGDFYGVRSRLEAAGFEFPPGTPRGRQAPHCRIGQGVLERWLKTRYDASARQATPIAALVGAHHGVPAQGPEVSALASDRYACVTDEVYPYASAWMRAQDAFLDLMTHELDAVEVVGVTLRRRMSPSLQVTLGGLIVVADWLASDSTRFPYAEDPEMSERLAAAALEIDILPPWDAALPDEDENLLRSRFGFDADVRPNGGQQALMDAAHTVSEPSLFVFEAPTGSGKTEASLMAAEILAARFGCGGVEFLLPTRGTTDGVWERLTPWIEKLPGQGRQSVSLAHGRAHLNDAFMEMTRRSRYAGVAEDGADADLVDTDCERLTEAYVSSWFTGRRKATLASMVAGTVDQLLLSALQTRHVALRHVGLTGKVVIIDECHAADDYMLVYLETALRWLGAHRVPTIAMSATLPDATRERLVAAYAGVKPETTSPAPVRLTTASPVGTRTVAPPLTSPDRRIIPTFIGPELGAVTAAAAAAAHDGACVAVIRNTVGEAQETYRALRDELGKNRVQLLHSRFLGVHRAAREHDLRRRLGPNASDRPRGFVIVATQVLEVSLDIDVDLMITDIAPLDVLFQRAGRLHRHRRGAGECERPERYREARLLISGCSEPSLLGSAPEVADGTAAVYGSHRVLRTAATLVSRAGQKVPLREVPALVQDAYADPGRSLPPGWREAMDEAEQRHFAKVADMEMRASAFALPAPTKRFINLMQLMPHRASETETEVRAAAQVRDSDDAIECIVVHADSYGAMFLTGTATGDGAHEDDLIPVELDPPTFAQARALARCTVTLPPRLTRHRFDATLAVVERATARFTGWQQSPLLRGELVLPLDEQGEITIGDTTLRYDYDLGLVEVNDASEDR